MSTQASEIKQENPLLNLGLNILIPVLILKNGADWFGLTSAPNLLIALTFPVAYFIYDLIRRRKANFISILGFVSILLTGGIGVLELPRSWFIAKESGLPFVIGLVIALSMKTKWPLVRNLLYNDNILDTTRINTLLDERNHRSAFKRLMNGCTWIIAASFFMSAAIQFLLASIIVTVEPSENPELFNEQVGDMTWITYLVILVPSFGITGFALWYLVRGLKELTGLRTLEEMLAPALREKPQESDAASS